MSDGALRAHVISALKRHPGIAVSVLPDGSIEVAKAGELLRVFPPFKDVVARGFLAKLERWYGIPIAAFYPRD